MAKTPRQATSVGTFMAYFDPALAGQFLKFGTVGAIGFVADTAIVYSLREVMNLYFAGLISYCIVASMNWGLNRAWTFRGHGSGPAHHQWVRFMLVNLLGLVLNRGTYAALIASFSLCRSQPVFAIAAGAIAGMLVNFTLSKKAVFI